MLVTDWVFNPDKSIEIKEIQELNIESIFKTELVLKLLKLTDTKELHPLNIFLSETNPEILKLEKSIDTIFPANRS